MMTAVNVVDVPLRANRAEEVLVCLPYVSTFGGRGLFVGPPSLCLRRDRELINAAPFPASLASNRSREREDASLSCLRSCDASFQICVERERG